MFMKNRKPYEEPPWLAKAKQTPISEVLIDLGCSESKRRWTPCPICGSAEDKTGRPPVRALPPTGRAVMHQFICNSCHASGSTLELVMLAQYSMTVEQSLAQKCYLKNLREFFDGKDFECKNRLITKPVVRYPPEAEVRAFCEAATGITKNKRVYDYLKSRGIDPAKVPARVSDPTFDLQTLTKVQAKYKGEITDRPWWMEKWLKSHPLIVPLFNPQGKLVSFVGRTAYKNYKYIKTMVPTGFQTHNLYHISPKAMEWLKGKNIPEKIWVCEGEIDYLTVAQFGAPTIGVRNGQMDSLQLLPWKAFQNVIIATHNDEAGNRYAQKIASFVQPAMPCRVNFNLLGG